MSGDRFYPFGGIDFVHGRCAMAPEDAPLHPFKHMHVHQCMEKERRCVYCGIALHPYPCNGCGEFLTTELMHAEQWRCEDCE